MTALDVFTLIVLAILVIGCIGVLLLLGMLPGKIAAKRNHPQSEAINICGWLGLLTGFLLPVAYIWAYTNPDATLIGNPKIKDEEVERC